VDQFLQHRYKVEKMIVDGTLGEFEKGKFTEAQMKEIADFTVVGMKNTKSLQDIYSFLKLLSSRWPIFQNLVTIEEGAMKEASDKKVYSNVLDLAKHGKIDEAVMLSKTATNSVIN
jgi:hypothetical protein